MAMVNSNVGLLVLCADIVPGQQALQQFLHRLHLRTIGPGSSCKCGVATSSTSSTIFLSSFFSLSFAEGKKCIFPSFRDLSSSNRQKRHWDISIWPSDALWRLPRTACDTREDLTFVIPATASGRRCPTHICPMKCTKRKET